MKTLTIFAILTFLISCTTASNNSASPLLAYNQYETTLNQENVASKASTYFAHSLLDGKDLMDPGIQSQLLFKDYMVRREGNTIQSTKNEEVCLTVNGYDKDNLPITFHLGYTLENSIWKINGIEVKFLESAEEFENQAKCPQKN